MIQPPSPDLNAKLSPAELDELDDFLASADVPESAMDVAALEGYLTAIVIGPQTVMPSRWLPWVWDMEDGQRDATFANLDQANRIMGLLMRFWNGIARAFMDDPASFEPIFWREAHWGAAEWSEGFILGFQFSDEAWSLLAVGQPTWFTPFLRLGTDDGIGITRRIGDAERWMNEIEPSLVKIHAYWKEQRDRQPAGLVGDDFHLGGRKEVVQAVRGGPKIGRNDSCPCGSGKKFKKCCGADGAPASVR